MVASLCRCFCGKDDIVLDAAKGSSFDALYTIEDHPGLPPQAFEALSYSVASDQPLRGNPVRQGDLWHLQSEEKAEKVTFSLYVNGFSFCGISQDEDCEVNVCLSPFTLVRNCTLQVHNPNCMAGSPDLKIFKLSLFTRNACYYYGVKAADIHEAEVERQRWVVAISRAVQLVTQSLFPPFNISCEPVARVAATVGRLMAGYLLFQEGTEIATVLYCELHPHCEVSGSAKMVFYEDELCQRIVMSFGITVSSKCFEKVGIDCSCFSIDDNHFSARTTQERKLWLRAISNLRVKLQNNAPTPSDEELRHYRGAIEEHISTIRAQLEGLAPIDPLLQSLPRKPLQAPPVARPSPASLPSPAPPGEATPKSLAAALATPEKRGHVLSTAAPTPVPRAAVEEAFLDSPAPEADTRTPTASDSMLQHVTNVSS